MIALAEEAGLDTSGTKADLAARLLTGAESETGGDTGEPTGDLEPEPEPELVTKTDPELVTTNYTPGTDAAFVVACFNGQLGRPPTKSELSHWLNKLYTGNSRNYIQNQFNLLDGNKGWRRRESLESIGPDSSLR